MAFLEILKFLLAVVAVGAALAGATWVVLALEPHSKLIREIVTGCLTLVALLGRLGISIYLAATEGWVAGMIALVGYVAVIGLVRMLFELASGVSFLLFDLPRALRKKRERDREPPGRQPSE